MIVKTKTDDFGNNTIGLNNPFKGLFNGDFFKRQNLLSDADITAIKAYNTEIDKCVTSQTAFKDCNFILPRIVNTYQSDDEEVRNKIKSNLKCNVQITYNPTAMIGYGYKS